MQYFASILEMSVADFHESTAVNLVAPFAFTRAVLPEMVERGAGTIVNVASDLAYRVQADASAYCATKHGLVALSEVSQLEHRADGVRVTLVQPGWIATGNDAQVRQEKGHMPAQEVANAVVWCCQRPSSVRVDTLTIHPMVQDS